MAFTLRITFSGLCLFVPESTGEGAGRMHVLMPGMYGHAHNPEDRHVAVISYDSGQLVQGGSALGVTTVSKLNGQQIAFGSGDAATLALCGHIVNLRDATGRSVDSDHLGADSKQKLTARVTLAAGGVTRVAPGVCWEWGPGEFRPIAHRLEWEIPNVEGDSITLTSEPIGGGGTTQNHGTLYPVDGRVSLDVFHETPQDLPPDPLPIAHQHPPMPGEAPKHFSAYYSLFGGPVPIRLPKYWGNLEDCPPVDNPCALIPPSMGGTPYNCIIAGSWP